MQKGRKVNKDNSPSKNELRLKLLELGRMALEKKEEGVKKRKFRPYLRPFMRFKAAESGFVGEEFGKADWTSASFVVVHEMEKLPLYKRIIDRIIELYGVDLEKASCWLWNLMIMGTQYLSRLRHP